MNDPDSYMNNVLVRPQHLGLEQQLSPFAQFNSSQRAVMFSSHSMHCMIVNGCEMPKIYTGKEAEFGEYEVNNVERDQPILVLAVIQKYLLQHGMYPIKENPMLTIIYKGLNDGQVGYFDIKTYTACSDGYGFLNIIKNRQYLSAGQIIPENVELYSSPAKVGNMYMLGVNANVAYTIQPQVAEDAFMVSESYANKNISTGIEIIDFKMNKKHIPLNLYGTSIEYKFIPDIGEVVRKDGILCGIRTCTDSSVIPDMTPEALSTPQYLHDTLYMVKPGAEVVDVDFYVNFNDKRIKQNSKELIQVKKYTDLMIKYYQRIVEVYEQCVDKGFPISGSFNTLVTKAMVYLLAEKSTKIKKLPGIKDNITFIKKKEAIEFIHARVVLAYPNKVHPGSKITGRDGAKGTIYKVVKDEYMPVDEQGIRADVVKCSMSVPSRLNPGQLYEQGINRISIFVERQIAEIVNSSNDILKAYEYALEYISEINENYANLIRNYTENFEDKLKFVEDILDKGIYLHIPPYLKSITRQKVKELAIKYNALPSKVTFAALDDDGNVMDWVTTKKPVCIGPKYMYILYNIPHVTSCGVGYINQFKTPEKPSNHARMQSHVNQTTLRFGEDEIRNLLMNVGPENTARIMGLYGNSPEAVNTMCRALLTHEKPTTIDKIPISTEEIVKTNAIIGVMKHFLSTVGVELSSGRSERSERAQDIIRNSFKR